MAWKTFELNFYYVKSVNKLSLKGLFLYYRVYTPFHEEGDISGGEKFGQALLNAMIVVGVVLGMTIILVLLYKYRFYKVCLFLPTYCFTNKLNSKLTNDILRLKFLH